MEVQLAKGLIDKSIRLRWTDRKGEVVEESVYVCSVQFVPFYGPCLITETGQVPLERIVGFSTSDDLAA